MNVKFQGFELDIQGTGILWEDYLAHLATKSGSEIRHGSFGRILCLDTAVDNKYALGLFVTIKDQKRFCEIREQSGQFQLVTRDLDDDARMADFNFFLLNKTSHRGIYQYYHQSCSLQQFLSFLISQFNSSKKDRIDEIRSADEALDTEATVTSIKETKLTTQILVKQESFEELIDEFRRIKELKFEFVTYDADSSIFRPIRDVMKKRTERVLFERDTSLLHQIGQGIKELV